MSAGDPVLAAEPVASFDARFSEPGSAPPPWSAVREVLVTSEMFWLSTVRADGRPHVTPIPAIWDRERLHICTGDQEQKARNLAADPRCVLTTGTNTLRAGLDVVVEGTAGRVTDREVLARLAGLWKSELDWDFAVGENSFRDADGRTGLVFAIDPAKVLAFGKNPYTQTRFTFPG
ncbi:pyridoxamine 5'-phosphate oxidase family protein [Nocardia sp. alder85J]|uniref:pyridoxamine 5'-phosphate oxidase family protein n=1 Tax=Nocardia sp. alder85J TaxID=2862949 RepID=UPI001CD5F630|nr:pyridoxamine 5'-phosphate oxidase family protein [Nocardia sp. alder85J]MCX4096212.1 pyridoxamine 5'-phosphate oxidase family protein [Nocardia sp. alder85J]